MYILQRAAVPLESATTTRRCQRAKATMTCLRRDVCRNVRLTYQGPRMMFAALAGLGQEHYVTPQKKSTLGVQRLLPSVNGTLQPVSCSK